MIDETIRQIHVRALQKKADLKAARKNIKILTEKIEKQEELSQYIYEARELLLESARISREKTIGYVEKVVTAALRAIFLDKSLGFKIQTKTSARSGLEAEYLVQWEQDGKMIEVDPMEAKGGSLIDVISTALKIIFLHTYKPRKRQVLWLDEPGKFIDKENRTRYAKWLHTLSHEFGVQINIITHEDEIIDSGDRIFRLFQDVNRIVQVSVEEGKASLAGYGFKEAV